MWLEYFKNYLGDTFEGFLREKPWNYKDDLCMIGAYDLFLATGDERYTDAIREKAHYLIDEDGRVSNWQDGEHNIDKVSFGKSLMILRELTGEERYKAAVEKCYRGLSDFPRTVTGNFWHKNIYPNQVWLDGLYMGMPFYAAAAAEGETSRFDDILDQFRTAHELLWDEARKLYLHANDCSREAEWADPETGRSPAVWLRAEGWFLMALVDTYEIAEKHTPRAAELKALLRPAVDGILGYQVPETKMFLQVVDMPELEGNYSETSGSAMVAYALMKGARLQMLPEEYWEKGREILNGIEDTYLKNEDGAFHLYGICASAGLGPGPDNRSDRTGTPAYYLSEKRMTDNQHGAGACMMAVSELLRRSSLDDGGE